MARWKQRVGETNIQRGWVLTCVRFSLFSFQPVIKCGEMFMQRAKASLTTGQERKIKKVWRKICWLFSFKATNESWFFLFFLSSARTHSVAPHSHIHFVFILYSTPSLPITASTAEMQCNLYSHSRGTNDPNFFVRCYCDRFTYEKWVRASNEI